jgi:mercuric reductase
MMPKRARATVSKSDDARGAVSGLTRRQAGRDWRWPAVSAPEAGEIIQTGTFVVKNCLTVGDLTSTLFPYLTYAEAIRLAAVSFDRDLSKLSRCV